MNVFVLNTNFEKIGVVDTYKSLIWANRYNDLGDCELYVEATTENVDLLKLGYYVFRSDDNMVCRIRKVEIDTSAENGNYLIVTGYDVKQWLDQRIIWDRILCDGVLVEKFLRSVVTKSLIAPTIAERKITDRNGNRKLELDAEAGFTERASGEVVYNNAGELMREYCKKYNYGYRIVLKDDNVFYFSLYKGENKENEVIFSNEYENLNSTKCVTDDTDIENVALVAGAGEGSERTIISMGDSSSVDRYEIYVDGKNIADTITWKELTDIYPDYKHGGAGQIESRPGNTYVYVLSMIDILIINDSHLSWLQTNYPGGVIVGRDGERYYFLGTTAYPNGIEIAALPSVSPSDNDNVELYDIIYGNYLFNEGNIGLSEHTEKITFEGAVIPNVNFIYKTDYNLGDIVTIKNEYGFSVPARIVEVVEAFDENGYSIEPKFEYLIGG